MKVLILIILLFGSLQAIEKPQEPIQISAVLEEVKEVEPDIFRFSLSLSVKTGRERDGVNILGEVDRAIRELGFKYSGGKYSLYKDCQWEKGRLRCVGYRGDLFYNFELKEVGKQNTVLETVERLKDKFGEALSYSVSPPSWVLSKKRIREVEEELRMDIVDRALGFSKGVGDRLGKNCSLSSIEYTAAGRPIHEGARVMTLEKATVEAPEPKKESVSITLSAFVRLLCR